MPSDLLLKGVALEFLVAGSDGQEPVVFDPAGEAALVRALEELERRGADVWTETIELLKLLVVLEEQESSPRCVATILEILGRKSALLAILQQHAALQQRAGIELVAPSPRQETGQVAPMFGAKAPDGAITASEMIRLHADPRLEQRPARSSRTRRAAAPVRTTPHAHSGSPPGIDVGGAAEASGPTSMGSQGHIAAPSGPLHPAPNEPRKRRRKLRRASGLVGFDEPGDPNAK